MSVETAARQRLGTPRRPATRWQALVEKFPVTTLLAFQYLVFAVRPGISHHTPLTGLLEEIVAVALVTAAAVEGAAVVLRRDPPQRQSTILTPSAATFILTVGAVAEMGVIFLGNVGYGQQVAGEANSRFAALFTPLAYWLLFGTVMVMWLYSEGKLSRKRCLLSVGVATVVELIAAYRTAFLSHILVFAFAVLTMAILLRLVRLWWVVVLAIAFPLVLPPLFSLRNELRASQRATPVLPNGVSVGATASSRMREDLYFAEVRNLGTLPVRLGQPNIPTLFEFGLVPRVLDRSRPALNTASDISVALGAPSTTSTTLTALGSGYALYGGEGVLAAAGLPALAIALALWRRSGWGYAYAAYIITNGIWIESNYPDFIAADLQALVSLAVAWAIVKLAKSFATQRVTPPVLAFTAAPALSRSGRVALASHMKTPSMAGEAAPLAERWGSLGRDLDNIWDEDGGPPPSPPTDYSASSPNLRRVIGKASIFNVVASVASGLAGLLAARYLGPTVKGQFAAVSSWFGWAVIVGELGQSAAIVYFVARDPRRARDYVATSRNIMLMTGGVVTVLGIILAPTLSHGASGLTLAYRVVFLLCPLAFVGSSFLFALQARNIRRWILIRSTQPITYFLVTVALIVSHRLTLDSAVAALVISVVASVVLSYWSCLADGLLGGRFDRRLGRNVIRYGTSQMLATTPYTANINLDQLVLSQTVRSSDLGQYSLAATLTTLAAPFVSPLGSVLFPRLAADREDSGNSKRLAWTAVGVTAVFSAAAMAALAALARELIPLIFGAKYKPSVDLIWIMAPSGVFYAINLVVGDLLRGRGQPLSVALAQLVGAVVTVAMLAVLIPLDGVTGAAITTSVTYGLVTLLLLIALRRPRTDRANGAPYQAGQRALTRLAGPIDVRPSEIWRPQ